MGLAQEIHFKNLQTLLTSKFTGAVELKAKLRGDIEAAQVGAGLYEVGPADDAAAFPGNQDEVGSGMRMLQNIQN